MNTGLERYADLFERPWWSVARSLVLAGHNVVVFDPARANPIERWSGRVEHGTVQVLPRLNAGWVVSVYEVPLLEDDLSDYRDDETEDTAESEQGPDPTPTPVPR